MLLTYLTNGYGMPSVPFTGVNYHHRSAYVRMYFTCEWDARNLQVVAKNLLEAMCGRTPTVIITDDDEVMEKAIRDVLPNNTHRQFGKSSYGYVINEVNQYKMGSFWSKPWFN